MNFSTASLVYFEPICTSERRLDAISPAYVNSCCALTVARPTDLSLPSNISSLYSLELLACAASLGFLDSSYTGAFLIFFFYSFSFKEQEVQIS